jgi:hypothetical protein
LLRLKARLCSVTITPFTLLLTDMDTKARCECWSALKPSVDKMKADPLYATVVLGLPPFGCELEGSDPAVKAAHATYVDCMAAPGGNQLCSA